MSVVRDVVFMYSGQGSHYYQMGCDLYQVNSSFRDHMRRLDEMVGSHLGVSVLATIYDEQKKKTDLFNQSSYTSAAIFMVERSLSLVLEEAGVRPDFVVGASMGSYAAACQAGCLDERGALTLLLAQAELLSNHGEVGAMIAVLDDVGCYADHPVLRECSEVASVNFHAHYVVAVPDHAQAQVMDYLKEAGLTYQVLAVTRPYHSRWIDKAKPAYLERFSSQAFKPPQVPFICCAKAGQVRQWQATDWWDTVRLPIRFLDTVEFLESMGSYDYVDVGPAGTLSTFAKYVLDEHAQSRCHTLLSPFEQGQTRLNELLNTLGLGEKASVC